MNEESSLLDLEINWSKTKIQASESIQGSSAPVLDHQVNLVDTFVYLGSSTDQDGGCDTNVRRRIELAHSYMRALDRGIWRTSISLPTKLHLYNIYILPVLLYGADAWSMTVTARRRLDAFDQWCLRHILLIPTQPMSQIWQAVSEQNRAESPAPF